MPSALPSTAPCPCCSGALFGSCCLPILQGEAAASAEDLMRSRYTAFVLRNEDHLFRSWHPRTRPAPPYTDPAIRFEGLRVIDRAGGEAEDEEGVVEFEARYRDPAGRPAVQRERSRFVRRAGRWVYLDGDVE